MFVLQQEPIDPQQWRARLQDTSCGACVSFEGWVRRQNEGRQVERLAYEAYEGMALREGGAILGEARERFGLEHVICVHRVGLLELGEVAVWVGASSPHRGEAFAACRYIIDTVKHSVPIWKKEHYVDGDSGWVQCEHCAAAHPPAAEEYYARQVRLPEVGASGQERLGQARILVVGAGGLGAPVLQYLAGAGVGTLGICEPDLLEASNLHRQTLFGWEDIGKPKAALAQQFVRRLNPHINVPTHEEAFTAENAAELLDGYDMVLDCTDSLEAKFAINDAAVRQGKTLVQAAIYQYEGQIFSYVPGVDSPCMRCIWPEMPPPHCVGSCAEVGVLGVVPGIFGALQALEALKLLLGLPGALVGRVLFYDLLSGRQMRVRSQQKADCPVCSAPAAAAGQDVPLEVEDLREALRMGFTLVDMRETEEAAAEPLPFECVALPASRLNPLQLPLARQERYLLCCSRGMRSRYLARYLREKGYGGVASLSGGVGAALRKAGPA